MTQRQTKYSQEQPQTTVDMQAEKDAVTPLWQFSADAFGGTSSKFSGLPCTPGAGLTVAIGYGSLYQYTQIDPTSWSTLGIDTTQWLLQGIQSGSQTITGFAAPGTVGQAINYLIEAQIQVVDSTPTLLPFWNQANPSNPVYISYSPTRVNQITYQVKTGTPAVSGSQVTPSPDSGWVPLYVVSVAYGITQLTTGSIAAAPNAPAFYGFVEINPSGNTPVYLNPTSQQVGAFNISGVGQVGTIQATNALFGGSPSNANYNSSYTSGLHGDFLTLTASGGFSGSSQVTDSMDIYGSIGYLGPHAGTDGDPYPISQLNVKMLGGKVASDYALAANNYIIIYGGAPTLGSGNAGITGYFEASYFLASTTTLCTNLNANFLGGYAAGNSTGNVPISNGTLNANLNAEFLGGNPSSYFQIAGNYATMNTTNSGYFAATGNLISTGGTGTNQIILGYSATNAYGINGGGAISFAQSNGVLALIGTGTVTNGPLTVGASGNQSATMQDANLNGLLRSGLCVYTVTYGGTSNTYPYPGNGTAWGYYDGYAGKVQVTADTLLNSTFYIGYRAIVTFASPITITITAMGLPSFRFYVDSSLKATLGPGIGGQAFVNFTAGQHTVDIVYTAYDMALAYYTGSEGAGSPWGGNATLMGWLPITSGSLSAAITSIKPG